MIANPIIKALLTDIKLEEGTHLIPLTEYKIIKSNKEIEYKMLVGLFHDDQLIQTAIIAPGDVYEYSKMLSKFGEKNLSQVEKEEYSEIINEYKNLISCVEIEEIYAISGWISDTEFILNNLLIRKDSVKKVNLLNEVNCNEISYKSSDADFVNELLSLFNEGIISEIFLIYKFLALIASRLPQNANSFSTLLTVIGTSGSRKTSTVNAFFNPFNNLSIQSSFEDTKASVEEGFRMCNDCVFIIDDMSKNNTKQTEILEKILRLIGDNTTGGKKMRGTNILNNKNKAFAVATGELLPMLPVSSLARLLVIEIDENSVNLEKLTLLQKNPDKLIGLEISFIKYIQNNPNILNEITSDFDGLRNDFLKTKRFWHPRCITTLAWFATGVKTLNKFWEREILNLEVFEEKFTKILQQQWLNHGSGDCVYNYIYALTEMIEMGERHARIQTNRSSNLYCN